MDREITRLLLTQRIYREGLTSKDTAGEIARQEDIICRTIGHEDSGWQHEHGCSRELSVGSLPVRAVEAPTAPVAIARCQRYGPELLPTLERMFDQLGGIERLVKGKTVAVKLNLTGSPGYRLGYLPVGLAQWVHPHVVGIVGVLTWAKLARIASGC